MARSDWRVDIDRERFDALTRLLATDGSRRKALAALLGVIWPGLALDSVAKEKDKRKKRDQGRRGQGVQEEGRQGAAHRKHHQSRQNHRQRRRKRRQQDRGQDTGSPSEPCAVPCAGACCEADQVCNESVIPNVCCTPPSPTTTCAGAKCGEVIDSCGQAIDCGGCPPHLCRTATCGSNDHLCHYTTDSNGDPCIPDVGKPGVCDNGQCVIGCDSNAECTGRTNTCTDHVCTCGGAATCAGPHERCCGDNPGGVCVDIFTDPNHCGICGGLCEGSTCVAVSCVDGQCHFAQAPDNTNPGSFCPGSEVCCGGQCTDVHGNVDNCGTCGHHCANPTPVCTEDGSCVACQTDAQCPPDQICCNGDCVDGTCRPTFCPCTHNDQCCRGLCEGGGPDDYYCCLGPFESCRSNSECCEGVCESGICG